MKKNKSQNKLVLKGSRKELEYLQALFESGELSQMLGVSVLDVRAVSESQPKLTTNLREWFQRQIIENWEYEVKLLGRLLATQNLALDSRSGDVARSITSASSATLLHDLNSEDNFLVALELGRRSNASPEIISALAEQLQTCNDEETCWQIALSLGKLDSKHPKAAVAQRKEILLGELMLELLVALKPREDKAFDILLQLYSTDEEYLPSELEILILNESGETITKAKSGDDTCYIHLSLVRSLDEQFTIKISYGDDSIEEYFLI